MIVNMRLIGWRRSDEAANMLTKAISGFFVQKRSICPSSYIKIDNVPILDMGIASEYDYILVLDTNQAEIEDYKSIKEDGIVIVNTSENKMGTAIMNIIKKKKAKLFVLDGTEISIEHTGIPDPSIAVLAAFAKKTNLLSLKHLEDVIKETHRSDGSLAVAEEAHKAVK